MGPVFRKSESLKPEEAAAAPAGSPRDAARETSSERRVSGSIALDSLTTPIFRRMNWGRGGCQWKRRVLRVLEKARRRLLKSKLFGLFIYVAPKWVGQNIVCFGLYYA